MATLMDKKIVRRPHSVYINGDILREAHVEALRSKKKLGQWLEEAIGEKLERDGKNPK